MNVYVVKFARAVCAPRVSGTPHSSSYIHVIARSLEGAIRAAGRDFPGVPVRAVDQLNYLEGQVVLSEDEPLAGRVS